MKLSTKGRYAVMAMADLAANGSEGRAVPLAEISALAMDCFRHLVTAPHVVVRVNETQHQGGRPTGHTVEDGRLAARPWFRFLLRGRAKL